MKIVNINGRNLVTQHIYDEIKSGSTWAPADGSNYTVEVVSVADGWVTYKDTQGHIYDKHPLAFQSRYCLVVLDGEVKPTKITSAEVTDSNGTLSLMVDGRDVFYLTPVPGAVLAEDDRQKIIDKIIEALGVNACNQPDLC